MKRKLCAFAVILAGFLPVVSQPVGSAARTNRANAIGLALVLATAFTTVIAYIVKALVGLRPTEEVETIGLDPAEHWEEGCHG